MDTVLVLILVCALHSGHEHEHCEIYHVEITPAYDRTMPEAVDQFCEIVTGVYKERDRVVTRCKDITFGKPIPMPKPEPEPEPEPEEIPIIKA